MGNDDATAHAASTEPSLASRRFWLLALTALGVVFGDIATSPIYAIRECFHGEYGIAVTPGNVYGVLSLVFWTLVLIVGIKYIIFVFRANNHGEGGVIALTALLIDSKSIGARAKLVYVALGVFAACLLYGDGMITPAISVLSAVEGISVITPLFNVYVIPLTILILVSLFLLQKHGTARIGNLFGPLVFLWISFLAVLGIAQIVHNPAVLSAVFPWHAVSFFIHNKLQGFVALGAVFLVVTGTEALYADMGHFGPKPIRYTWLCFVFPAVLLNYFGQGALLLSNPELSSHPFYAMVPPQLLTPAVILATIATIIASQAVISGAFSMTRQAIQLGFFPRLKVSHTSAVQIGQIYIGPINWMLMICTIALVLIFKSSSMLAAAYGVAVTSTMLATTILFINIARHRFNWTPVKCTLVLLLFLAIDLPFFSSNFSKVFHGAWLPLLIGALFFAIMWTWKAGRALLTKKVIQGTMNIEQFKAMLQESPPQIVDGCAVFLTGRPNTIPFALLQNLRHNRVLHNQTVVLHFKVEDIPRVADKDKIAIEIIGDGIFGVSAHNGFMEDVEIEQTLQLANSKGLNIDLSKASYFLGRERLVLGAKPALPRWIAGLFLLISRNTTDISSFFNIPTNQVIEVGVQMEL